MFRKFMILLALLPVILVTANASDETPESQSYGYGYGTKVQDQYSSSTVYVHGFGTINGKKRYNDHSVPYHGEGHLPGAYGKPHAYNSYQYGQINEYGDAKHGYGFDYGGKANAYPYARPGYKHASPDYGYNTPAVYTPVYHSPYNAKPVYPHYNQYKPHYSSSGFSHGYGYGYGEIH